MQGIAIKIIYSYPFLTISITCVFYFSFLASHLKSLAYFL